MDIFQKRVNVWNNTKKICKQHFTDVSESIKCRPSSSNEHNFTKKYETTEIKIINMDTIDAVWYAKDNLESKFPVLLNMASYSFPGGGVDMGCEAQEENIFRRSNYFLTLNFDTKFYPIMDSSTIYSPDVTIFRHGEHENTFYEYMEYPRKVSIIASPSICRPELNNGHFTQEDYNMEYEKIEMIFRTAAHFKHDTLILSAYGCGAFKCPPEDVSLIFKYIIKKYNGVFKYVIFAIIDNSDSRNFSVFKQNLL